MWTNAWRALDALGVGDELRGRYPPLARAIIRAADGRELRSTAIADCTPVGTHEARVVARADLVATLAAPLLAASPDAVRYGARVVAATPSPDGRSATVTLADGASAVCRAVVGADGVGSAVAAGLGVRPPRYVGYAAVRGVAAFGSQAAVPAAIAPGTINFWYGDGARAGAIPLGSDGRVYFFTVANARAPGPLRTPPAACRAEALATAASFTDAADVVAALVAAAPDASLSRAPIADRWPTAGARWGRGAVTLAGDAAHPMTPNLGQGGCVALEDAVVLARCLVEGERAGESASASLERYEKQQSSRALKVAAKSYVVGVVGQASGPLATAARDAVLSKVFPMTSFLEHAAYDCGGLPV